MAAPNIANVTSILGKTAFDSNVNTSASTTLGNAASSNKVLKINTIIAANIDGTNSADITVSVMQTSTSQIKIYLANTISVPADTSLVVISIDL